MGRFLERVHDVCERYPDRVAFVDDIRSMTFAELWEESGKVFAYLAEKGLGTEDFCQIVLPRSAPSMASLLGVLRAGCAFCNLDVDGGRQNGQKLWLQKRGMSAIVSMLQRSERAGHNPHL